MKYNDVPPPPPLRISSVSKMRLPSNPLLNAYPSNPINVADSPCPNPHTTPIRPARDHGRLTHRGMTAARWSGPEMACSAPATIPPAIVAVSADNALAADVDNIAVVVVEDDDVACAVVVIAAAAMTLGSAFSCDVVDDDDDDDDDAILTPRLVVFIAVAAAAADDETNA